MVLYVIRSILHGGPTELFSHISQCSTTGITNPVICLWDIKDPLLLIEKSSLAHVLVLYHMSDSI